MLLRGRMLVVTGGTSGVAGTIFRTAAPERTNVVLDDGAGPRTVR